MPHTIINDADPDSLISRLSRPLAVADRENFCTAARAALADVRMHGEGSNYRALKDLQRRFFDPPSDRVAHWDIEQELRDTKLKSLPPIEHNGDLRRVPRKQHVR